MCIILFFFWDFCEAIKIFTKGAKNCEKNKINLQIDSCSVIMKNKKTLKHNIQRNKIIKIQILLICSCQ